MEIILDPRPIDRILYLKVATLAIDCGVRAPDNVYTFQGTARCEQLDIQILDELNPRRKFWRSPLTWLSIGVRAIDYARPTENRTLSVLQLWGNMKDEDNDLQVCSAQHLRLDFRASDDPNNNGIAAAADLVPSPTCPQLTLTERRKMSSMLTDLIAQERPGQPLDSYAG